MKRVVTIVAPFIVAVSLVAWFTHLTLSGHIDVLQPAGDIAARQKQLLFFTLSLSALVVLPVFGLLAFISVRYRASNNTRASYKPDWSDSNWLESLWWGIPIVIIGILAVVTYQTSHSLDPSKPLAGSEPLKIQVVALQWKWLFLYPDDNVATLNYFAMPINRPVAFQLTAQAPMSAFWIPSLGSQTYAMNGMASNLNLNATKVGSYTGYSTNINGSGYATMTFKAKAMDTTEYVDWKQSAQKSERTLTTKTYQDLRVQKSETDERTYRMNDKELFDTIMNEHSSHSMAHKKALQ